MMRVLAFAAAVVLVLLPALADNYVLRVATTMLIGAMVAPWTMRNFVESNALVLISSNAGVDFYIGHSDGADGRGRIVSDPYFNLGLTGGDASEWICRGPVPTAGPGNDMKAPAGRRHRRNRPCRDHDGLLVGTAVGIRQGQPDLVRRVRIEKEDTAREHVGATVVDANEWQRRTPPGGPGDSKLHRRRGVMVGIADKIPLNTD